MTKAVPKIETITMGTVAAPLNSTVLNRSLLTTTGTSWRHTLSVTSTAQTITFDEWASSVEFITDDIPVAPIYIKWWNQAWQEAASSTNFDEKLCAGKCPIQVGITNFCNSYSIVSASSQTVQTIERFNH
jgi:hypothetical protein